MDSERVIFLIAHHGLGDAIYLRAVVLHMLARGEAVTVFTRWPDVFSDLPIVVKRENDTTPEDVRSVSYSTRLPIVGGISDFEMRCQNAGINEPVDLRMDWRVRNPALLKRIREEADGRKIFIYQCARQVQNLPSKLLKPRREAFNQFIADHGNYFRIKLGHPPHVTDDPDAQCEMDLFGKAFVLDTFDVCTIGDLFFSQPSFINFIAEALDKRFVCMFARAALNSNVARANTTTPERLFHKRHLATAVYDD